MDKDIFIPENAVLLFKRIDNLLGGLRSIECFVLVKSAQFNRAEHKWSSNLGEHCLIELRGVEQVKVLLLNVLLFFHLTAAEHGLMSRHLLFNFLISLVSILSLLFGALLLLSGGKLSLSQFFFCGFDLALIGKFNFFLH